MKSHTRVAVIGGGVVGCSALYHLTKAGWKDVVLIERDQLTAGSTWHAAGGFHTLNGDPNVAKLQGYTIALYDELERISGQSCGLHRSGGLLLADTPERMEWLKMAHGRARYLGLETSLLSPREAKELLPLIEEKYFVGAMLDAADGNLDPYGTTHAYAKSARIGGAEIYLQTRVTAVTRRTDGTWDVATTAGTLNAEHVVNAGGLWAREVGRMVGLELPVLAMEHMYLVTDDMPEVIEYNRTRGREVP
ncbi:MAG TPA: FAD-dependent oxidoreductase, partial [Steroidobacteraceae bacterium]|nr:FAD-dependent oxidoreductase [Steroidobacteraceae bacterium]